MRKSMRLGLGLLGLVVLIGATLLIRPDRVTGNPFDDPEPKIQATLRIDSQRPKIIFDLEEVAPDFKKYLQAQVNLLKSRFVLDRALSSPRIAQLEVIQRQNDPSEWLQRELVVTSDEGSEMVTIALRSGTPEDRAAIINAVVGAYMAEVVDKEHELRLTRLQFLEKLYAQYQEDLKKNRASLRKLAESVGSADREKLELRGKLRGEALSLREKALLDLRLKQVEAEVLAERHKDKPDAAALQDQLAVVTAQRDVLEKEREQLVEQASDDARQSHSNALDLQSEQDRVALVARTAEHVGTEVQALRIELNAPRRVRVIDQARATKER
jgi:hypothetical protein